MAADPYHGVTMAFSDANSGTTMLLTNLGEFEEFLESVETTHHGVTGQRTNKPEVLTTTGPMELEFHFEADNALPIFNATPETGTFTIPIPAESSDTTAGTIAGTGYFTNRKIGEMPSGSTDTVKGTATWVWDGATDAAFTPQAA